jgi:hypothetical protein
MMGLIEDKTNVKVVYEDTVSNERTGWQGLWDKLIGPPQTGVGLTTTPSGGYQDYQVSLPTDPKDTRDPDAAPSGVRAAHPGERWAHEVLGHAWGELKGGNPAYQDGQPNKANQRDALNAENNRRAETRDGGRKTYHGGQRIID